MSQPQPPTFSKLSVFIIWIILLTVTTLIFNSVLNNIENPNQTVVLETNQYGDKTLVLKRNRYGHYVASGKINGYPVDFLVDTGATLVSIPEHIADHIGLKRGRGFRSQTANGSSQSYYTELDSLTLGSITMHHVQAGISSGMKFDQVLLGMSFLKYLQLSQTGNELRLQLP